MLTEQTEEGTYENWPDWNWAVLSPKTEIDWEDSCIGLLTSLIDIGVNGVNVLPRGRNQERSERNKMLVKRKHKENHNMNHNE